MRSVVLYTSTVHLTIMSRKKPYLKKKVRTLSSFVGGSTFKEEVSLGKSIIFLAGAFTKKGMDKDTKLTNQPKIESPWFKNTYSGGLCDIACHQGLDSSEARPGLLSGQTQT